GGCVEGPGYWNYATTYTVYYLAALQTALGTDFGYLKTPGLAETGLFRIHTIGPTGKSFNFADAKDGVAGAAQMFWLARAFDRPVYAAHERMLRADGKPGVFHLLWFDPRGGEQDVAALPTAMMYQRVNIALFRGAWNDPDAAYV